MHPGGIKTDIVRGGRHYEDAMGAAVDTMQAAARLAETARTTPEEAARVIMRGILSDEPRILIGPDAVAIDLIARLAPRR